MIEDKLWLPTEYEMFGTHAYSSSYYESNGTQANFTDYYTNNNYRIKSDASNTPKNYWVSSPYISSNGQFCLVSNTGGNGTLVVNDYNVGVVPAFCVK
jgi:hypothetical protein